VWRRRLVAIGVALVVIGALVAVVSWRWFVHPRTDGPVAADAIVMFGGSGDRFERAVELADAGWADVLVISDPIDDGDRYSAHGWFCRNDGRSPDHPVQDRDYEAICFDPETHTTRGEARYVARLAEERGWRRIVLVTTTEQATRARILLSRCWEGDIAAVTVATEQFRPARIVYEWGAMLRATVQRRGC
jgi:hypothetical protein